MLLISFVSTGYAELFKTQDAALKQAFPEGAEISRKVLFLTDEQVDGIQKLAKAKVESKIVTYYIASKNDSVIGYAFFESGIVRTKPATFMVVVSLDGSIKYVDVLAFYEPLDYLPTRNWLELFKGKVLDQSLWPKREIHNITGATLTVRAITMGVRKILAVHKIAIAKGGTN